MPEKKFDYHWRYKVSSDEKEVRRVSLLISSRLTSEVLAQGYERRATEPVRHRHVHYPLICASNILLVQNSST